MLTPLSHRGSVPLFVLPLLWLPLLLLLLLPPRRATAGGSVPCPPSQRHRRALISCAAIVDVIVLQPDLMVHTWLCHVRTQPASVCLAPDDLVHVIAELTPPLILKRGIENQCAVGEREEQRYVTSRGLVRSRVQMLELPLQMPYIRDP